MHTGDGLTRRDTATAIVLLSVGLVSLSAASGWATGAESAARETLNRMVALQATLEELRAVPFDELAPGSRSLGEFDVSWTLEEQEANSALVELVAVGPLGTHTSADGVRIRVRPSVDTLHYRRVRR